MNFYLIFALYDTGKSTKHEVATINWFQICFICVFLSHKYKKMLRLSQTKDYKTVICCLFAKHAALRRKNKNWLAKNQDNLSEWGDMCLRGLLFQGYI
jgi:hypothetical protein